MFSNNPRCPFCSNRNIPTDTEQCSRCRRRIIEQFCIVCGRARRFSSDEKEEGCWYCGAIFNAEQIEAINALSIDASGQVTAEEARLVLCENCGSLTSQSEIFCQNCGATRKR